MATMLWKWVACWERPWEGTVFWRSIWWDKPASLMRRNPLLKGSDSIAFLPRKKGWCGGSWDEFWVWIPWCLVGRSRGFFLGGEANSYITSCVSLLEVDYICVVNEFVQVLCKRRFVPVFFFAPFTVQKDPFYVCYVMAFRWRFLHSLHL